MGFACLTKTLLVSFNVTALSQHPSSGLGSLLCCKSQSYPADFFRANVICA